MTKDLEINYWENKKIIMFSQIINVLERYDQQYNLF